MKKMLILTLAIFLSGCATAKEGKAEEAGGAGEAISYTEAQLQEYAGTYDKRVVAVRDGELYLGRAPNANMPLSATAKKDVFVIKPMGNQEVTFLRNDKGQVDKMRKPNRSGDMITVDKS